MFEKLEKENINEVEKKYIEKWKNINILDKCIQNRSKDWVFYDGPATANGKPGIHHMVAKELKDSFCKYKTMQGYRVLRKVGWDTHGLPVEVQVEKQLGFNGKKDIENYGIKEFNEKCRESVWENETAFKNLTDNMGQFIDTKNPYITYDNNYIETEWWILKKYFDKGLLYNGYKITPYCSRCGTSLSSHEVAQEYKEVSVNTVIVPFKLKGDDSYFLAWTTTPWTLMANVALCVNPNSKYVKVESKGYKFILASSLVSKVLKEGYTVLEQYTGKDLEYIEYEQLMPFIETNKKAFFMTCADYVTMEDGTGIVHIAPAFGQDDYEVGLKYDLPVLNPVGEDGKYNVGPWTGRLVVDTELEIDIIKWLKENDKLFKKQKMVHNYPHCWRCKTPLIYYAKPSWYIKTTAYKDKIIEANSKVNWYPSYVGEKRFNNWLENMVDWGISRNRYWGTPIPIWTCNCGHIECIGSKQELIDKSIEKIDNSIELHRPFIDDVHIKCSKCGKVMTRVTDVLDCWFDSGAMPFAQYHYPFENEELFESQFPADFIAEGVDQTRGWFYTLLVISTFVKGVSPYKNVLVNDLLLDKYGHKMHKSRGNAIEPFSIINEYGADTIRFYLLSVSPVWTPIKFDIDGLKEIYSKYISTFKNAYSFFEMYANADDIDPRNYSIEVKDRELIDKWLISKLNKLIKNVTNAYEEFDLNKVTKYIIPFLNDDLSNWYIRSNRRRFWESELTESKKAVYLTTYEVLLALAKLTAPITPFISEEIYTKLTGNESVHLADFPKYREDYIDEEIEEKMDLVRDICSLGRDARETANIKVRQPISEIVVSSSIKDIVGNLDSIIKEELNVKNINYQDDMTKYLKYSLKPNFKVLGKKLGSKIKLLQEELKKLSSDDAYKVSSSPVTIKLDGEDFILDNENTISSIEVMEGYVASNDSKVCVVLNTELNDNLILEGLAREFVRKVQSLRKDNDYIITDRITIKYDGSDIITNAIKQYEDYIKNETLADNIISDSLSSEEYDLNGIMVKIITQKDEK